MTMFYSHLGDFVNGLVRRIRDTAAASNSNNNEELKSSTSNHEPRALTTPQYNTRKIWHVVLVLWYC